MRIVLFLFLWLFTFSFGWSQLEPRDLYSHVVKIECKDCKGISSGFFYESNQYVITTYHGFRKANTHPDNGLEVTVIYQGNTYPGKIIKNEKLFEKDIALIRVYKTPKDAKCILSAQMDVTKPKSLETLYYVLGYDANNLAHVDHRTILYHNFSLKPKDGIPDLVRDFANHQLSLVNPIRTFEGQLYPGFSGGPVVYIDKERKNFYLVAIQQGCVYDKRIVYTIPADVLKDLKLNSPSEIQSPGETKETSTQIDSKYVDFLKEQNVPAQWIKKKLTKGFSVPLPSEAMVTQSALNTNVFFGTGKNYDLLYKLVTKEEAKMESDAFIRLFKNIGNINDWKKASKNRIFGWLETDEENYSYFNFYNEKTGMYILGTCQSHPGLPTPYSKLISLVRITNYEAFLNEKDAIILKVAAGLYHK